MTKENKLKVLEVLIEKGGLTDHTDHFYASYIKKLNITFEEFDEYLDVLLAADYLDEEDCVINPSTRQLYEQLRQEIEAEEISKASDAKHKKAERRLTRLQVNTYWVYVGLAVVGAVTGIISLLKPDFDESQYIKKSDLDKILKEYTKNKKHEGDLMGLHDLIYRDSTLVNKK